MEGFLPLSRALLGWDWHSEPKTAWLYVVMLMQANWEDTLWRGETLRRGQLLTGRKKLADASGLSEQEVRTALEHLKKSGDVEVRSKSRFSVVTLLRYEEHCPADQTTNQQSTSNSTTNQPAEQPTDNQQSTSNQPADNHIQKVKNNKKLKNDDDEARATAAAEEQIIGFDGSDLSQAMLDYDRADELVRRYRLPDSDISRDALLQDAQEHGFDAVEDALKTAALSNSRPMLSVAYYRAVLKNAGGKREEYDPYAGMQWF